VRPGVDVHRGAAQEPDPGHAGLLGKLHRERRRRGERGEQQGALGGEQPGRVQPAGAREDPLRLAQPACTRSIRRRAVRRVWPAFRAGCNSRGPHPPNRY